MNKTRKNKIKNNTTKKNKQNDEIDAKMNVYSTFIDELKDMLVNTKSLFDIKLQSVEQKEFKLSSEVAFNYAYKYYNKNIGNKSKNYIISSNPKCEIQYNATNKRESVAKGTFNLKNNPQIVNFYQVDTSYDTQTYRFGTPVYTFKNVNSIIKNILMFKQSKKKLINISLLSPCNTKACKQLAVVSKPLSKVSELFKKGLSATKEDNIIQNELTSSNKDINGLTFFTILFPLSSQTYTGVGSQYMPNMQTFEYDKLILKSYIEDDKVAKIYQFIDG